MQNEKVTGVPIGNVLYTSEGKQSSERTRAELKVEDPAPEKVLEVLTDEQKAT